MLSDPQSVSVISFAALLPQRRGEILAQCATIDAARYDEFGLRYSEERWTPRSFKEDRPGKAQLSYVVVDPNGDVQGFWVASKKVDRIHHTHRVATRREASARYETSLAARLGAASLEAARNLGCDLAQLTVQEDNRRAIELYRQMGYAMVTGASLRDWAVGNGYAEPQVQGDRLILDQHYRLVVMQLRLASGVQDSR